MSLTQQIKAVIAKAYRDGNFSVLWMQKQTHEAYERLRYNTVHSCIIVPISGSATYSFDGASFQAKPGVLIHGCPGLELTIRVGSTPFEHINIYYEADSTQDVMLRPWSMRLPDVKHNHELLESLIELGKTKSLSARLNQIVGASTWLSGIFDKDESALSTTGALESAKSYIEAHFIEHIKVSDLASKSGLSAQGFSTEFKRAFGISPQALITMLRLERARTLLAANLAVKDVAHMVGYNDPLYFSRVFKSHTGVSPTQMWT